MREMINALLPVDERVETELLVAIVRTVLSEYAFDEAWRQGRSMTPEHIVRDAGVTPAAVTKAAWPDLMRLALQTRLVLR